jgi:hypothetical protein
MTNAIMDFILMGLLIAALLFGMRLDKRLKALRAAHEGFAKAVHDLDNAAIRAHNSLKELRLDADESQDLLHGRILAAREVVQKLDAQVARAERVQRELDKGLVNYDALQSLKSQPITAHARQESARPEPEPEDTLRFKPRGAGVREAHMSENGAPENIAAAFERDMVRRGRPILNSVVDPVARPSRLPDLKPDDETEILDKVQMSELVVANLNEMIRTLTLPKRQVSAVEDDLFGGNDRAAFERKR